MNIVGISEALSNGLSISSILILTGLGLGITFGVMRVINMAHGEMLMLGAYVAYLVEEPAALPALIRNIAKLLHVNPGNPGPGFDLNIFWSIPIAFVAVGFIGYLLEVCLIRFLYGRPLDTLLATWGVSLIIQQVVLLTFGADLKPVSTPEILNGHWEVGPVAFPIYRAFVVGVTGLCLLLVYLMFYQTSMGLKVRAVTQNRPMASALGISTRRVDAFTFAFASGLAGVAGCILAHLYTVKYTMGSDYVVQAFMVVILGGMGQLPGIVAGGLVMGLGQSFAEKFIGSDFLKVQFTGLMGDEATRHFLGSPSALAKFFVLVTVVAFILARPSGLFATKERSYD